MGLLCRKSSNGLELADSLRDPALSSNSFRQSLKTNLFHRYATTQHTQRSRDLHDSALYKSIIRV